MQQSILLKTYGQTAEILSLSERSVWQLVRDGELKALRIGRSVRIPLTEIERFVKENAR